MDSKRIKEQKFRTHTHAESLVVDKKLQDRARNSLEKSHHNINLMSEDINQKIDMKKDLLEKLRTRRINSDHGDELDKSIRESIVSIRHHSTKKIDTVDNKSVKTIDIDRDDFNSKEYNYVFAEAEHIELNNPFERMFGNIERVSHNEETIKKFDLLQLDNYDYMFATASGLIAGLIDVLFVGTIKKGKDAKGLQKFVDSKVNTLVKKYGLMEKIAELEEHKKHAKPENIDKINQTIREYKTGKRPWDLKSSIRYLEKNHKVSYDEVRSHSVPGMSPDNHHLYSLAHEPSLLGLLIGVYNQLSNVSTFINSEGKIVNIPVENITNKIDGPIHEKIIKATENWFGHLMSDVAGSSGSKGRGSGLPVPGWAALQKLQFGSIKLKPSSNETVNIAQLTDWMFKNGYDLRSFTAELIPVVIYETLIRIYWFYKQHIYFGKTIKESLPVANNRELSRLLLVGAATFTAVDTTHATVKGIAKTGGAGMDIGTFVMTINKPGLIDLGFRSLQTAHFEIKHYRHLKKVIDEEILLEYSKSINRKMFFE